MLVKHEQLFSQPEPGLAHSAVFSHKGRMLTNISVAPGVLNPRCYNENDF